MRTLLAPVLASGTDRWKVDPLHSRVRFTVRQFLVGTVRGEFANVGGIVRTLEGDPRVHIDVRIPVSDVSTGAVWRDSYLRSPALFDAASYPTIAFLGRRIRGNHRGEFSVDGDLTMHGTTRDTILRVTARDRVVDESGRLERATFHATTRIDRRDFGMLAPNVIEAGGLVLGREMRVEINLDLIPASREVYERAVHSWP